SRRKKRGSRAGVETLAWLDLWGKTLGYKIEEYNCMPIGELQDLINLSLAKDGFVTIRKASTNVKKENGNDFMPTNLR
ncbi:MAG: hypothetical protein ACRDBM_04215, partial [Sporomusa sp.]